MSHPSRTAEVQTPSVLSDRVLRVTGELASATDTQHSGKRMLADVLWEAANGHLWDGEGDYDAAPYGQWRFSCDAATCWPDGLESVGKDQIKVFLRSLGCDTSAQDLFGAFDFGPERQGVRYMWLLLAMHVAEDEGLPL